MIDPEIKNIIKEFTEKKNWVYLIGNGESGFSKIGITTNLRMRLLSLDNPKLPFELLVLAKYEVKGRRTAFAVEKLLHQHFNKQRTRGEWFTDINPDEFIRKAQALSEAI